MAMSSRLLGYLTRKYQTIALISDNPLTKLMHLLGDGLPHHSPNFGTLSFSARLFLLEIRVVGSAFNQ